MREFDGTNPEDNGPRLPYDPAMGLTRQRMLDLAAARDARYDGRFLTGVLSTGIFCLPSCPARQPKPENVRFFYSPEAAVAAGLRACQRCRPELFYQRRDPDLEALEALVRAVRRRPEEFADVDALARSAGFGRSKLHRLLRRCYHIGPAALLQAARMARARELLRSSEQRILDIGLDVGFESDSAFHDNFLRAHGMAPGSYRSMTRGDDFALQLPRDFNPTTTWRYLGRDPESPTERVGPRSVWRALDLEGESAVVEVSIDGAHAAVRLHASRPLSPEAMGRLHDRIWRWLGLASEPRAFERHAARRPGWAELLRRNRGLRIPQTPTVFEGLVWALVGQQVNLAFAYRLRRTLIELAGESVDAAERGGLRPHPGPAAVARLDYADLTRRQFSRRKAEYVIDAARAASARGAGIERLPGLAAPRAAAELEAIRGVGEWTQQYVLMRACGFADCVPTGDAGLVNALRRFHGLDERPDSATTRELMQPLSPYRSLATAHLWASLSASEGA
jgi:AraC family transcriptional regulator, regulatory protein of adaptative response / DNA-3-methyladenine glycosylase II